MEKHDYKAEMYEDIKAYIEENDFDITCEDAAESLGDALWVCDSVTGNASGSYTFNAWRAEENLCHNWDLLQEACEEFGMDFCKLGGAEAMDVTIRCYLLHEMIDEVLSDMSEAA